MIGTPVIDNAEDLRFGISPFPVTCGNDVIIGGGKVFPEINFTLPPMPITERTLDAVIAEYRQMVSGVCSRAVELQCEAFLIEIELLPDLTSRPEWGEQVIARAMEIIKDFREKESLRIALRATPVDIRDKNKPPKRRTGEECAILMECFERCARAGADILSIESTGGKETSDDALMEGDISGSLFSLLVLGVRDMEYIWRKIASISGTHGIIAGGDTACAFGNTAMILADKKMISRVFAAVVRAVSAVRSMVAYEHGAVGPGKDCGYENIILKALTGLPMSMEGKSSACAHLSHVGNVAYAAADLVSNESVQNVRLLSEMAPIVSMEQLIYDCRLLNAAGANDGDACLMRDWLVSSDARFDPQAFIISPHAAVELAKTISSCRTYYEAGTHAARRSLELLGAANKSGYLSLPPMELRWMGLIEDALSNLPQDEGTFIEMNLRKYSGRIIPSEYGL